MRRIAALAAIIFGLTTLVAVPAVIIAAPASALSCDASHHVETDGTGQQFCAQNSGTGGGASVTCSDAVSYTHLTLPTKRIV